MLRKIIPVAIILILMLSIVGYFPLLKIKQWEIKRQVCANIHAPALKKLLCIFSVAPGDKTTLSWEEAGKEFRLRDRMYDVITSDTLNGLVNYYCIADDEETTLLNTMEDLLERENNGDGNRTILKLVKLLFSFLYVLSDKAILTGPTESAENTVPGLNLCLSTFSGDILQPPK
jgi:hypothetical protein